MFDPVVILPSYNNAGTLAGVLSGVAALGLPIVLVNDGCTDDSQPVLRQWMESHPDARVQVLTHSRNRGKAAALRTGFRAAIRAGRTHAITIDTDGQHDPQFAASLLEIARQHPQAYVLGVRDDRRADYPARSRTGRRISNLLIRLECGLKVADSQCGLRVYPLDLLRTVRCRAGRFAYETEMITRAGWAGCPIVEATVNTRYLPPGQRVTHFRPWLDTLHAALTHARLLLRAVTPIPHPRYQAAGVPPRRRFPVRDVLRWMNPLRAWRELRAGEIDRTELAAALAVGVFVANLPLYPFQTVLALYLARRLHLNPLAVLGGAQLSTPPISVVLIAGGVCLGHLLLHATLPAWPDFHAVHLPWWTLARPLLIDWAIGGTLMGIVLGAITFVIANWLLPETIDSAKQGPSKSQTVGPPDGLGDPPSSGNPGEGWEGGNLPRAHRAAPTLTLPRSTGGGG